MNEQDIVRRAAQALVRSADHEASYYEAQTPVEDWALDALQAAILGDAAEAEALLDRYEHAKWEERRAYAISDWGDGCGTIVRAANVP